MTLRSLWQWFVSAIQSELFIDWLGLSIFGLAMWLGGCMDVRQQLPLSIPKWLSFLICKRYASGAVYLRSLLMQVVGILLLVWSTVLALAVPNHVQRVHLYVWGALVLSAVATIPILIRELS